MLRLALAALFTVTIITGTGIAAPPNAPAASVPSGSALVSTTTALTAGLVLINEVANGGPRSDSDTFFELRNWGTESVSLAGWHVYRCSAQGLRSNLGRTEAELARVVLAPGEIFTVSGVGQSGDAHYTQPISMLGTGIYLENASGQRADAVGIYPNAPWPTASECTIGRNLPNSLNFALDESWQRVAATGDVSVDFIAAPSTPTTDNATHWSPRSEASVVISEVALAGPRASDDEFIELRNIGDTVQKIGGWQVFRCTATGRLRPNTLQVTVANGTELAPGETWVAASEGYRGDSDARYATELADVSAGVRVQSATGELVDRVSVSNYADSACQDGDDKLDATMDAVAGESYQRTPTGWVVAPRTPGSRNAEVATAVFTSTVDYSAGRSVAISEIATDPGGDALPAGMRQRNFVELANYGSVPVDIGGWTVRRCEATGVRSRDEPVRIALGTILAPGDAVVIARTGTAEAASAVATYPTSLNMLGAGVWVENARGARADSVGIYAANEMDSPNVTSSPCTKGNALTTYQPDRLREESFQRAGFSGNDAEDFVTARATPGVIDERAVGGSTARVVAAGPEVPSANSVSDLDDRWSAPAGSRGADVLQGWSGVSFQGSLASRIGNDEVALAEPAAAIASDDGWGYPYQRFELDASDLVAGSQVSWSGTATGRGELQLSVWNAETSEWRLLDAAIGPEVSLGGALIAGDIVFGDAASGNTATVDLLVQAGPRTERTLAPAPDAAPENPAAYDFAISHITDTQYLSESYPEVYAQLVSWIAANADDRKIEFATHTGDLVQNWVDPNQNDVRARIEFERASAIQSILDDAGVPNSVLPGNHDNKRGAGNELFNEYFPPSRYADNDWYGASIAPDDNSSNFSTFDHEGARFLMLSLPYAYGEGEIAWAEQVVAAHPRHNVIISTHEHVTPKTTIEEAHRSANSRWVSHAQDLWERVIAPNRNVVLVLSGHFHGLGQLVTENAGGLEGHTVVELLADYQEFRTHTGERATGFQRLLQVDLASGTIAVDTFSVRLDAASSFEFDYPQFVPENGVATTKSNARPWFIVEAGVQGRYDASDDEFEAVVEFQYAKSVGTTALLVADPVQASPSAGAKTKEILARRLL